MMIVDIGVPTGFTTVGESLAALVDEGLVSRVEVAGRKVILYVDGLTSGETRQFSLQVRARFPVRAVIPDSKAYLYYDPDIRAETAGTNITVSFDNVCLGDMTYDGWLSPADISALISLLLPKASNGYWVQAEQASCGDLDGDDWLSPSDVSALVSMLLPHGGNAYWLKCP